MAQFSVIVRETVEKEQVIEAADLGQVLDKVYSMTKKDWPESTTVSGGSRETIRVEKVESK